MLNQQELLTRLSTLEQESKLLEPQGAQLKTLTTEIVDYAHNYLNNIGEIDAYKGGESKGKLLTENPFKEEARNLTQLLNSIQEDGRIYVSSTSINGVFWLRIAVLVFRTHVDTINEFLTLLQEKRG